MYDEWVGEKFSDDQAEAFVLAVSSLVRKVRTKAPAELREFSWTQKSVLSRLEREGPATSADLARAEGLTPQSMGAAISVLEGAGLVERAAHPTDGRQIVIRLSANGLSLRDRSKAARESWLFQALERLDEREVATLFEAGEIMKRMAANP